MVRACNRKVAPLRNLTPESTLETLPSGVQLKVLIQDITSGESAAPRYARAPYFYRN
jgi:hypothetical protein